MKKLTFAVLLGIAGFGAGCGHNTYSAPVGVNLHAQSGDVSTSGTLTREKQIALQTGNPYAGFLIDARTKLGKDPSDVGVGGLTLFLGAQSSGVTVLEQVFTGQVDVLFRLPSNTSYSVGHVTNPTGAGPVNMNVDFDSTKVMGLDHVALMSGNFKVVIRGSAAALFPAQNADADLQHNFTFKAMK